ncbi:hypothetical protein TL16_g09192 [Triparma laevis f. inornata]|uniref:Uncharacterized protein n=2 Tax=Triparma laevis TaxID=1534972 RepID=A0A9W7ASF2_9STRA|nr:hypothetical protein TrLO_g9972 [Triparma laevis f. longispina]GMH82240.1 hypothetical protein TL16_g09192 [Triparma laevis f. inornata]
MPGPVLQVEELVPYVTLSLHLMNWEFMNFEIPIRTSTYLFSVRKMLEDRHGRIQDLKICLGSYLEEKEMKDEMLTLQEYFEKNEPLIEGVSKAENEKDATKVVVKLYYDFKPIEAGPILLDWQA